MIGFRTVLSAALVLLLVSCRGESPPAPAEDSDVQLMRRVCDWQLAHQSDTWTTLRGREVPLASTDWIRAVFFAGVMATYRGTQDGTYLREAFDWAQSNGWKLGPVANADDHCAAQVYLELATTPLAARVDLSHVQARFEATLDASPPGHWWWPWCDALFMEPPAWAGLTAHSGDGRYLRAMDVQFWDTVDALYDPRHHLFYRDERYVPGQRPDHPVFWGRGNGWVVAGITRVLDAAPPGFPSRARYEALFTEMCDRIVQLARPQGGWGASLLDPQRWSEPETSGSALFCAALAWGIRNELLEPARFRPVLERAWERVVSAVQPDGRVAWVQLPADEPRPATVDTSMEYGAGVVLLAAEQMLLLRGQ